jgi:hypothetical protein
MFWFFNIFAEIFCVKIGVFDSKQSKVWKNLSVFKKNANFFAENWKKSQKIVIITSTPIQEHLTAFYIHTHIGMSEQFSDAYSQEQTYICFEDWAKSPCLCNHALNFVYVRQRR